MWDPAYTHEEGWIVHRYDLPTGNVFRMAAQGVRKEPTGVHAKLAIRLNTVTLAWSNFNVEHDEGRVRLVNSAYGHLDTQVNALDIQTFPKNVLKHALDLFCDGLWAEVVASMKGELLEGDPNLPPANLILGDHLIDEGGHIIFSPPGFGKSYTALLMAVSLDAGMDRLWPLPDGPRRCLFVNIERSRSSIQRRLASVNRTLGLDPRRALPFLNARGRTFRDILEATVETRRDYQAEVLFLDSLSRTGYGDLTADKTANAAMDDLNEMFPTWIALGHSPRQDDSHVFGSQMFDAATDVSIQLTSQANEHEACTGVGLRVTKANDIERGHLAIHVLEWTKAGLVGVRKARSNEFPDIEANRKQSLKEEVEDYLRLVGTASATDIAKELGRDRSKVSLLLNNSNTFVVAKKEGKSVLYSILSQREA